jgi:NDP-sugar pyrophosphorylase family protein
MKTAITKAMILAAGEGTRLHPHTLAVPKPMLPVSGRPTLEWIVLWLKHYGIREIVVNLCHRPRPVLDYFGDSRDWGVNLFFSVEETMLGTAGGIKRVESRLQEPFVLVYGDVLTDMDLGKFLEFHGACGEDPHITLSLCRAPHPWECGVVAVDGGHRVTRFVEKPPREQIFSDLTNAGILAIDPPILEHIPDSDFSDVSRDLLPKLLQNRTPMYAMPLEAADYLIDIGTPEKYGRAQREWPTERARQWAGKKDVIS